MHDLILVGGGLANGLLAYRLRQIRPELELLLIEQDPRLGGNHTWSFFATDLTPSQLEWMAPFIEHRWPFYDVAFPQLERRLHTPYASFTSERFHPLVMAALEDAIRLDTAVQAIDPHGVTLIGGERLPARTVIDGRGYRPAPSLVLGYQKFTGQVVSLGRDHGLEGPVLMDARVPQTGDFRFFYTLPLDARRLLIEDTRYSDHVALDPERDTAAIEAYARRHGWQIDAVERRESGVLPVVLAGDIDVFWSGVDDVAQSGMRAGLFHATTGYSLPLAVALADRVAALPELAGPVLKQIILQHSTAHWRRQGFYRLLNRMLFRAATPDERYRVFQRFYGLSQGLIERFYADRLTRYDRLRILAGKPPVPFGRALGVVRESAVMGG